MRARGSGSPSWTRNRRNRTQADTGDDQAGAAYQSVLDWDVEEPDSETDCAGMRDSELPANHRYKFDLILRRKCWPVSI